MRSFATVPYPKNRQPTRWDFPFSDEMTAVDINQIRNIEPFSQLDDGNFRPPCSLEQILRNDSRIRYCNPGDVVVREGEFGNSVFFVMFGRMRVSLDARRVPTASQQRRQSGSLQAVFDWWKKRRAPEVRLRANEFQQGWLDANDANEGRCLYLPDVGMLLNDDRTALLQAGQFFGEVAALGRTPRNATVTAETSAALFEIRWQGIRDVMRRDDGLRRYIEESFRDRALARLLKGIPEVRSLTDIDIDELVKQARFESYGEFRATKPSTSQTESQGIIGYTSEPTIRKQGVCANDVLLLRTGVARITHDTEQQCGTVSYLTAGQVFGMDELLSCQRDFRCSLHAIGHVSIVAIPRYLIENMLYVPPFRLTPRAAGSLGVELDNVEVVDRGRVDLLSDAELEPEAGLLEFLRSERYTAGTSTMMIDLNRCTRCDDCVRACATAHNNNPRFIRQGQTFGNHLLPTACLHCEDPVCLIDCPTGAIHRNRLGGEVVINEQTCIGCAACANNCPYDSIRMVEIRDEQGDFHIDPRGMPLQQATKCDLCAGRLGGPACQEACPHDALRRIDMSSLGTLDQ